MRSIRDTQVNTILENQMGENFLGSFHVDEVSNLFVGKKTAGFLFSIMPSESISEMKMGHLIAFSFKKTAFQCGLIPRVNTRI